MDHFLHFYPSKNPKNQNFTKMKKSSEDIIILHMCTINDTHMIYGSWDMEHDRQSFSSFCAIFCTFSPLKTWKIKIKKRRKILEILSLYTVVPKIMILCYTVAEIWHMMDVIVIFHFGLSFTYPPNSPKNENFKKWKKACRYYHFTQVCQKSWSYAALFLRYGVWRM